MTYEAFFTGVGGTVLGTLLGAWLTCRLTFGFQQRLLLQQLDFLRHQAETDAEFRKKIHDETIATLKEIRHQVHNGFELMRRNPPGQN